MLQLRTGVLGKPGSLWLVGAALLLVIVGTNLPTPLYAVYGRAFGFSSGVLTLIFAIYAVVLIPSLLVFGPLSDKVGRRPIIAAGLVVAGSSSLLFALASGTGWLFAARAVQGVAVGACSGAMTAALVELETGPDRRRAAVVATLAMAGGSAVGPAIAGALAEWAPNPLRLSYLLEMMLLLLTAAGTLAIREPLGSKGSLAGWRPQWPDVPRAIRAEFLSASAIAFVVWAVGALFLSVVPSYVGQLLRTENLALLGSVPALMMGTACVVQVAGRGIPPRLAARIGLLLVMAGLVALALAFPPRSLWLLLLGSLVAGAGQGLGFFGSQSDINQAAPAECRAQVTSSFFVAIYVGVSVPVVGVGFLAGRVSLPIAVDTFTVVVGVVAVAALLLSLRLSPTRQRHSSDRSDR